MTLPELPAPPGSPAPARRAMTVRGSHLHAFGAVEWSLVATIALTWGSTFLFVELAVRDLRPEVFALLRVIVAVLLLAPVPDARRLIRREDRGVLVVLGILWIAVPLVLVPFAQLRITSSLTAMVNSTGPLATTLVAAVMLRRAPRALHVAGFVVALAGLLLIAWRTSDGGGTSASGVGLVLGAVACYAVGFNLAVPLQQRYGAAALLLQAQLVAAVVLAPFAALQVGRSRFTTEAVLATIAVGALASSVAFLAVSTLLGRVGAPRAAITLYLVPAVATLLGVVVLDEHLPGRAVAGLALVLAGAGLLSRRELT